MSDELTLKIKKDSLWKYSTFILLAIVLVGGFVFLSGDNEVNPTPGNNNPDGVVQPSKVQASVDDDAVLGDENAEVTIIEFSDYQCPFCERFWSQTLPLIKSQYIETGKVRFVYRDFPLTSIHPMAQPAAEAAECVGKLGGDDAYYQMHDKLFENINSLSVDNMKTWAKELGYNIDTCLDSGEMRSEVQKDIQDGSKAGVRGTPYFVIMKTGDKEGTPLSGAQPFNAFQEVIESYL